MRLSRHFDLEEFLRSETASRKGIVLEPTPVQIERLTWLCTHILEPLRVATCRPTRINSGFRSPELNRAIGGASKSAHMEGRAADIENGWPNIQLAEFIYKHNFDYDKLILEFPSKTDPHAGWVHVQVAVKGDFPRHERYTAKRVDGKTVYVHGLQP